MSDDVMTRLRHSLQALSVPAEDQLRLMPEFVCRADELALEYDHWRGVAMGADPPLTDLQRSRLEALDSYLAAMSGQTNAALWTEEALRNAPEWRRVRHLAAEALRAFEWPTEVPLSYADEFIRGR